MAQISDCARDTVAVSSTSHRPREGCACNSSMSAACRFRPSRFEYSALRASNLLAVAGCAITCALTSTPKRERLARFAARHQLRVGEDKLGLIELVGSAHHMGAGLA